MPDSHHDMAMRGGAQAGLREKPMAMHAGECESMIEACRAAACCSRVYRRAMPKFTRIKALVDEGTIGDVRAVTTVLYQSYAPPAGTVPWRVDPRKAGGGLFVDLAPHTLDFLDYVLGPITDVAGAAGNQAGRYRAEDIVSMRFAFGSGVQGVGLWAFSLGTSLDRTELLGSHGRIAFSTFGDDPIVVETGDGTASIGIARPEHVQQPLIQTVVDDLRGRGHCPSTGESALRTTRVTDAALRSYSAPPTPDAP
jgi:predicted dehydrogenase